MLIGSIDRETEQELLLFIKEINAAAGSSWGFIVADRAPLGTIDIDGLIMAIKPAMLDVNKANVFFGKHSVYIAWSGQQSRTRSHLIGVLKALCDPMQMTAGTITYMNPIAEANELNARVKKELALQPQSVATPRQPETKAATPATFVDVPKMGPADQAMFEAVSLSQQEHSGLIERKRAHSKLSVLIIEDQPFLRHLLFEALRKDHDVAMATSVREGLAIYIKEAPHIVFLDIGLPDASGHLLARKLREIDNTAYIVMVTGSRLRDDVEAARKNGARGFIVKPFSKSIIEDSIGRYATTHSDLLSGRH